FTTGPRTPSPENLVVNGSALARVQAKARLARTAREAVRRVRTVTSMLAPLGFSVPFFRGLSCLGGRGRPPEEEGMLPTMPPGAKPNFGKALPDIRQVGLCRFCGLRLPSRF